MKPEIDQEMQEHIDELRSIPCGRGHSRQDAYLGFTIKGNPFLGCKQCARERYETVRSLEVRVDRLEKLIKKMEDLERRAKMMAGR